jgi:hypothetical protein
MLIARSALAVPEHHQVSVWVKQLVKMAMRALYDALEFGELRKQVAVDHVGKGLGQTQVDFGRMLEVKAIRCELRAHELLHAVAAVAPIHLRFVEFGKGSKDVGQPPHHEYRGVPRRQLAGIGEKLSVLLERPDEPRNGQQVRTRPPQLGIDDLREDPRTERTRHFMPLPGVRGIAEQVVVDPIDGHPTRPSEVPVPRASLVGREQRFNRLEVVDQVVPVQIVTRIVTPFDGRLGLPHRVIAQDEALFDELVGAEFRL